MDNKIKITASLLLCFLLCSCVGWMENDSFYERPLNSWASVRYFSNQGYQGKDFTIYFSPNDLTSKDKRIELDFNYERTPAIIQNCTNTIYNNDYILARNKRNANDSSSLLIDCYYRIIPSTINQMDNYSIDTITKSDFDILVADCKDCQELTADKIRQLDYELDHGGFPSKTVLFFGLIIVFLYFRYRRKKKKYKSNGF